MSISDSNNPEEPDSPPVTPEPTTGEKRVGDSLGPSEPRILASHCEETPKSSNTLSPSGQVDRVEKIIGAGVTWEKAGVICQMAMAVAATVGIFLTVSNIKTTRYELELSQSAQLNVASPEVRDLRTGNPKVTILLENSGKTPSTQARVLWKIDVIDPLRSNQEDAETIKSRFKDFSGLETPVPNIGGSQSLALTMRFDQHQISKADVEKVLAGDRRLLVLGVLEYSTIFAPASSKRFCLTFDPGSGPVDVDFGNLASTLAPDDSDEARAIRQGGAAIDKSLLKRPQALSKCLTGND